MLLVAFAVFSLGVWKARVGFGEDGEPLLEALRAVEAGTYPRNLYVLAYTLLLRFATPDPLTAALLMRSSVSLFTTLALYYVLSAFRTHLRHLAVVLACVVWMVSHCNAPLVQSSNLSLFTFSIAAVGLGWLVRRPSWKGFAGFAAAIACAVSLRPEYAAPGLLIVGFAGPVSLWQTWKARVRPGWLWALVIAASLLATAVVAPRFRPGSTMDRYLLLGLGQCYATFYKAEHPEAAFHPMAEYQRLLGETFGQPTSFFQAIANNPREACRYFARNSSANLARLVPTLLSTRDAPVPSSLFTGRLNVLFLGATLLIGGGLLGRRMVTALCGPDALPWKEALVAWRRQQAALLWKILMLLLFCSAASVAILLLVPASRYWISCVPLVFLGVAGCFDSLLRLRLLEKRTWLVWVPAMVLLCRPLFLGLGPNENAEVHALRSLIPVLRERPVIAGLWTRPLQAYAFLGHAVSVNAWEDLSAANVREGRYDVFIVDPLLRASRIWDDSRLFFEGFESDPAQYGYAKMTAANSGTAAIYFRPQARREP